MNEVQFTGRLVKSYPVESGVNKQNKEWSKLTFVIETEDEKYPKLIAMILFGDKTSYIEKFKIGDVLEVRCNVESKEYKGKWFTNVNAFAVNLVRSAGRGNFALNESERHEAAYNRASSGNKNDPPF